MFNLYNISVAAAGATLGFNFVKIGIPPGMGSSFLLAKATNPQVAARLLLTGDLIKYPHSSIKVSPPKTPK